MGANDSCGAYVLTELTDRTGLAGALSGGDGATAADHFEVRQSALMQLPETDLGREILVWIDTDGQTKAPLPPITAMPIIRFSVGYELKARARERRGPVSIDTVPRDQHRRLLPHRVHHRPDRHRHCRRAPVKV